MKISGFLLGLLSGALVGGVVGLMLAPYSGGELRGQIQERVQSVQDEMKQAAELRRAELEQQLAQLRAPRKAAPPTVE